MSSTPLGDSRELLERSIFHAIRREVVDKGYLPDILLKLENNIVTIDNTLKIISIAGNHTSTYSVARKFEILGSTNNNGQYTITSVSYSSPNTLITIQETLTSSTANGKLSIYKYYDDDAGVLKFNDDISSIVTIKGFSIEVFGNSASPKKYIKKVPRIVVIVGQSLPGDIGGGPTTYYKPTNGNYLSPDNFNKYQLPPQTTNISFDIFIVSNSAKQSRILHSLVALSLPKRGYIPFYNDSSQHFYIENFSYRNLDNTIEGINEDVYMYTSKDIFETEEVLSGSTKPITEITVETNEGELGSSKPFNTIIID
jgi:hypothetical protein